MASLSLDLCRSPRRWAEFATGTQRVVECDQSDSSAVIEMLRAQGWESAEVGTDEETGRTAIAVGRADLADDHDAVRGALQDSGFEVSER